MADLLCTSKYRAAVHLAEHLPALERETPASLGAWYASIITAGPKRYLHYMNSRTLLPIVIWLCESRTAEERMRSALLDLLRELSVPEATSAAEVQALASLTYYRATDRSRLASMRDQLASAKAAVRYGLAVLPWDLTIRLADMPTGVLAYRTPSEVTVELLGGSRVVKFAGA